MIKAAQSSPFLHSSPLQWFSSVSNATNNIPSIALHINTKWRQPPLRLEQLIRSFKTYSFSTPSIRIRTLFCPGFPSRLFFFAMYFLHIFSAGQLLYLFLNIPPFEQTSQWNIASEHTLKVCVCSVRGKFGLRNLFHFIFCRSKCKQCENYTNLSWWDGITDQKKTSFLLLTMSYS